MTTIKASNDNGLVKVAVGLSPLARAALDCGVDIDDVYEYEKTRNTVIKTQVNDASFYEAVDNMAEAGDTVIGGMYDAALNRSQRAMASDSIAASRPFWHNI